MKSILIFALASLSLYSQANPIQDYNWNLWTGIPYLSHSTKVETQNKESASCSSLVNSVLTEIHQLNCGSSDFRDLKAKLKSINKAASSFPQIWFKYDHMMYVFSNEEGNQYALHSPFSESLIEPLESVKSKVNWIKISVYDLLGICQTASQQK